MNDINFLRKISKPSLLFKAVKYGVASAGMYLAVFSALYLFVDILQFPAEIVFPTVYFFAYFFDYLISLKFVFNSAHNKIRLLYYLSYLVTFYIINNIVFYVMFKILSFSHMLSAIIVVLFLFPLRFVVQNLIFKKTSKEIK